MKNKASAKKQKPVKHTQEMKPETVLLLRTVSSKGLSYNGFKWPLKEGSTVEATDWSPRASCGNGLHGLLWGRGNGALLNWDKSAVWMVIEALKSETVEIDNEKAKCKRCTVVHVGDQKSATEYMAKRSPDPSGIVGGTASAGQYGTASAGDGGTASAGDGGNLAIKHYDHKNKRYRLVCADVGEHGILPGVPYRLVEETGQIVINEDAVNAIVRGLMAFNRKSDR